LRPIQIDPPRQLGLPKAGGNGQFEEPNNSLELTPKTPPNYQGSFIQGRPNFKGALISQGSPKERFVTGCLIRGPFSAIRYSF